MNNLKHILIQPLRTSWKAPNLNIPWDNNSFFTLSKLLQADAYHIESPNIDLNANIYWMCSFDIGLLKKEIEFAKRIKELNKKFILSFSQDLRFLLGNFLVNDEGIHYGDLCNYADVILAGMNPNIKVFGRNQYKLMEFGLPVERITFPTIPFNNRKIDILVSNNAGEENWGFTTEFLFYLKEKFPNKEIAYSTSLPTQKIHPQLRNIITFVPFGLINYLKNAKIYINLELRPRPGRSLLESYYFDVPFIASSFSYFSKLFPDFTFNFLDFEFIIESCNVLLEEKNHLNYLQKAKEIMEFVYFDNFYKRLIKKIFY